MPFVIPFRGKGATTPLLNVIKSFEVGVVGMANTFRPDGANPLPLYAYYLPLVVSTPERVGSGKATRVFQPALATMPSDIDREYCLSRHVGRAALERMNALANESQTWKVIVYRVRAEEAGVSSDRAGRSGSGQRYAAYSSADAS